mmetsp:Transcript_46291/g.86755  ORF Transcript_46291/g.86755 Transcript_46291/m.86755 type:complete len:207 (+) Transcript_46291:278-898(+)
MPSRIFNGKMPLSASAGTTPMQTSLAVDVTLKPGCFESTLCSHSSHERSPCFSSGTYAATANCVSPAEKIILPICPEPPLRSSSVGSDLAFMAFIDAANSSSSPAGNSTAVQKNCRPPMSAAPSISTPRFPPSLVTFFRRAFRSASGSTVFSSFLGSSFFASLPPFFLPSFLGLALGSSFAGSPAPPPTNASAAAFAAGSLLGSGA